MVKSSPCPMHMDKYCTKSSFQSSIRLYFLRLFLFLTINDLLQQFEDYVMGFALRKRQPIFFISILAIELYNFIWYSVQCQLLRRRQVPCYSTCEPLPTPINTTMRRGKSVLNNLNLDIAARYDSICKKGI